VVPVLSTPTAAPACASLREFVTAVLEELGSRKIRYAVLHSWDQLPEHLPSDLDIAVAGVDAWRIPGVLAAIERRGFRPVQYLNYAVHAHYFVFAWTEGGTLATAAVDFITEHREGNLILTSADELVEGRRQFRGFWIPSAAAQFRYLLSKKVLKRSLPARQSRQLAVLAEELGPEETRRVCDRLFGGRWGERAAEASREEKLGDLLGSLRLRLWFRAFVKRPWTLLRFPLTELPRVLNRLTHPTGLVIAVLGPDGAGKSTLIENLGAQLDGAFRLRHLFHWRPGLLFKGRRRPESRPHSRQPLGPLASVAHLMGHLADHILGFPLRIRPLLVHSGLVLFDRYFDDIVADPARYRCSAPASLVRVTAALRPRPDLMLVLEAPAEVIAARKQETTQQAIAESAEQYRRLAEQPFACRIDARLAPDEVALRAANAAVDLLHGRMVRRHGEWLQEPCAEALHDAASLLHGEYAILPSRKNPRWLVPLDGDLAVWAPYARKGHLLKACLSAAIRMGAARTVAFDGDGRLDDLVHEVLHVRDAHFSASLGAPGRYRKATVQITADGRLQGFLKIPLTEDASLRIEHEASVLAQLTAVPALRPFLPEVVYAGRFDGRFVLLEAPVGGEPGETHFGGDHRLFLAELARHQNRPRYARKLIEDVARAWDGVAYLLDGAERKTVAEALRSAERTWGDLSLDCGLIHGDFAPWNTRRCAERLRVLDWEAAENRRPHDWDAFHFEAQTACLLGRDCGAALDRSTPSARCSYVLYLISSIAALLAERGDNARDVNYRLREVHRVC
jgi:thymidylate kinase